MCNQQFLSYTVWSIYDAIPVPEELKGSVLKQARVGPSKTDLNVIGATNNYCGALIKDNLDFYPQCDDCSFKSKVASRRRMTEIHYYTSWAN